MFSVQFQIKYNNDRRIALCFYYFHFNIIIYLVDTKAKPDNCNFPPSCVCNAGVDEDKAL